MNWDMHGTIPPETQEANAMSEAPELKPCPFCGGKAEFERKGDRRQSTIIVCLDCGCTLENGETFDHGTAWNTRPLYDAQAKAVEGLINEAVGMADGSDEAEYIEKRLRRSLAALQESSHD